MKTPIRKFLEDYVNGFAQIGAGDCCPIEQVILASCTVETDDAITLEKLCEPKGCFTNAGSLAVAQSEQYEYAEGFVLLDDMPIAIHHGWLMDRFSNQVVETTLDLTDRTAWYMGVRFPDTQYTEEVCKWGYWGLFDGATGVNVELLNRLCPGVISNDKSTAE